MKLNEKIRKLRDEAGEDQESLGVALNVSGATVSRYETEEIDPPTNKIKAIAKHYDVNLGWLVDDNRDWPPARSIKIAESGNEELDDLISFVMRVPRDKLATAKAILKAYIEN